MVERWSPKPKVIGSNPIAPVFLKFVDVLFIMNVFLKNVLEQTRHIKWLKFKEVFILNIVVFFVVLSLSCFFYVVDSVYLYMLKFIIL